MKLFCVRLIYNRAPHEAAVRTAVSAHPDADAACAWLAGEVGVKRELPGYRLVSALAEDVTDYARAFVAAHPEAA